MSEFLVVGAGFYGLTFAQRLAEAGEKVRIVERRLHIGGNAYSEFDPETGIEIHKYGSHLFHTSNKHIWDYCNRFTEFTNYQHSVWTVHKGEVYSLPINLLTIQNYFRTKLSPDEARKLLLSQSEHFAVARNLEEKAISLIGRPLYEAFVKSYTEKQWQTDPKCLPAETITRLPVRYNYNSRYFDDEYQGLPVNGYTSWLEQMIDHPNISIEYGIDFFEIKKKLTKFQKVVYSGPLDRYFNFQFGALGWRTLDFDWAVHNTPDYQGTAVLNYADLDIPWTRVHEFRHLHPERDYGEKTITATEYSRFAEGNDEPFYPINSRDDQSRLKKYRELASQERNVIFGGRLGSYKYLDMHMAIGAALARFESLSIRHK